MKKALMIVVMAIVLAVFCSACESVLAVRDDVIRLHILANSDGKDDQSLKLGIRDYVLERWSSKLAQQPDSQTAWLELQVLSADIEKDLVEHLAEQSVDYSATVETGIYDFPDRDYDGVVLPAGRYRALEVKLGEGKGKNWWCVMFPPLCLVSETGEMDLEQYKQLIEKLDEEGALDDAPAPKAPVRSWLYDNLKDGEAWDESFAQWTKKYWLTGG